MWSHIFNNNMPGRYIGQEALERHCLDGGGSNIVKDHVPVVESLLQSGAARVGVGAEWCMPFMGGALVGRLGRECC